MIIIRNNLIPFKGFKAINLFGVLFLREGCLLSAEDLNHERIHTRQMKELGYVLFYILYLMEWMVRLFLSGNAYQNISFEREAYRHQKEMGYLPDRKMFAQWRRGKVH